VAPTVYRPGERAPVSGIYAVVDILATPLDREITSEEGETFPPTVHPDEYGYVLVRETVHER
jgi:YjzC-like protein